MKNIDNIKLNINSTIKEALRIIDNGALQLLGTLTDSIYIVLLNLLFLKEDILKLALSKKLHQIPIVDNDGKILETYKRKDK